jgi:glycerol kinase
VSVLVIDVGTSGLRAAIVRPDATIDHVLYRALPPTSPFPGLVEFDPRALASAVLEVATAVLQRGGPVAAVGVATQRASTVVWDRATGEPVGPGLSWQDLRTVMECIGLDADHGVKMAPNQSATKAQWLLRSVPHLDPADLCIGTIDSWVAWTLTEGRRHVTDRTNAGLTGLCLPDVSGWDHHVASLTQVPVGSLPELADTSSHHGEATALPGAPPITALVGDQQASLVGQGCVTTGVAKITFGTGGMLDVVSDRGAPASVRRNPHGTFPIAAWSRGGTTVFGAEGIMLAAGTTIDWLRDDLGLIDTAAASHEVASRCDDSNGVLFVPALLGLGTPHWDYGARGTLVGLTRGTRREHVVRAVLEGIAHRGADLVEAGEADTGCAIPVLRVDGGMSRNPTFVQALADATQRRVEVSPVVEATTLGAAFLAGLEVGIWSSFHDIAAAWSPAEIVEPRRVLDRDLWQRAVARSGGWIPDLSALDF